MNKTSQYDMTIVIPVYNEEDNMYALEKKLTAYLPDCSVKACVLFVNDGSKDSSLEKIKEICGRNEDFYYISFEKNGGVSAVMKAGIEATESPLMAEIDADMQTDVEDFNLLLQYTDEYEMVKGMRVKRQDTLSKKLQSKIANAFRRMITHDGVMDTVCPLKILRTSYAKQMPIFTGMHRFFPALIQLQGGKVKELAVRHYPRVAGVSKFSLWNRVFVGFIDCFAFVYIRARYIRYVIKESNI